MKYLVLMISFFVLTSCYNDVQNVQIHGTIIDSLSKKPVEKVKISIVCWSYSKTPDGSYTSQDSVIVTTNKDGLYKSNFEKGAFVEIKAYKDGYKTGFKSEEIRDNEVIINLDLKNQGNNL